MTRGLVRYALCAALVGVCALAPPAQARKTVTVEGFRAAAPRNGAPIPKVVAKPGARLTRCHRRDALLVVFSYAGMNQRRDRIAVRWYRNGKKFFFGAARRPVGADGRAFRSVSPGVANGRYRVDIVLNGKVAARAAVVKACRR